MVDVPIASSHASASWSLEVVWSAGRERLWCFLDALATQVGCGEPVNSVLRVPLVSASDAWC